MPFQLYFVRQKLILPYPVPDKAADFANELELSTLTGVLFAINAALEDDRGKEITFDDVYNHLDAGDLIPFLDAQLQSLDLSFLGPHNKQGELLLAAFREVSGNFRERERRKTGIEHSGVCLVIAWIVELIQDGQWNIKSKYFAERRDLYTFRPKNMVDFPRDNPPASNS